MRRDAPIFERRAGGRPMCGRRATTTIVRVTTRPQVESDEQRDPDVSFVDKLRDPEQSTSRRDQDPEPPEPQRDPEHDAEITPDEEEDEESRPGRRAAQHPRH